MAPALENGAEVTVENMGDSTEDVGTDTSTNLPMSGQEPVAADGTSLKTTSPDQQAPVMEGQPPASLPQDTCSHHQISQVPKSHTQKSSDTMAGAEGLVAALNNAHYYFPPDEPSGTTIIGPELQVNLEEQKKPKSQTPEKRTLSVQDEAATILAPGSKSLPKKRKLEGSTEESTKKGRTGVKRAAIKSREMKAATTPIPMMTMRGEAAAEAIAKFHHDPKNKINYGLRRLCCTLAWFAPESGTSSRPLAIHVMTTKQGNLICPYHTISDHRGCAYDEDRREDRAYRLTGVPKAPIKKSTKKNPKNPDPRYMHCGCPLETVLLEFFFWKSDTIYSPTLRRTEGWDGNVLNPRERGLIYGKWTEKTGQKLVHLYRLTED
ncbi:hypothetical protein BDP27DRAFT_1378410 [Rhodocollybia butyracea]|uniref:Uncharacterized protein n=1 Tax=Rhodocollybia butyracea TaxID=206335 RepID=A0A9P5P2M2_9AGAR|nr:hypothetical protein BDP27DRAFT_1378410 [Rhodocollybia butyracea]